MALIMKNGKEVKSFLGKDVDKNTKKYKKSLITQWKWNVPFVSWPKDKEQLLSIINTYLSQVELGKLSEIADAFDDKIESVEETAVEEVKTEDAEKVESTENAEAQENTEAETQQESTEDNSKSKNSEDVDTEEKKAEVDENSKETDIVEELVKASKTSAETDEDDIDEDEYAELPDQLYEIDGCSAKVLGNIVRILNYRYKALKKIRIMKKAQMDSELIVPEIEKVAVYNIVLAKFLPILNKQEIVDKINLRTATHIFEDVCTEGYEEIPTQTSIESEIKKNKEDQDFDIVSALAYVGVNVDKDDYGYYSIKSYNNGNGIKYFIGKSEKTFALSKNACAKFVDEFLNKPIEKRKFITPGQVFISYINEAEKSLGISSRSAVELQGLFGAMNSSKNTKQYFKDMIKKYSRNAQEWKDFQKLFEGEYYSNKESKDDVTNKIHIKQQAKRLVIGDLFEEILNYGDILSAEQIAISDYRISDISRDFGLDVDIDGIEVNRTKVERLEDQTFRIVNSMHNSLQQLRAFTQDIIDNYTVDYLRKEKIFLLQQDDQKEYINKKKEYEDLIKRLSYDKDKDSNEKIAYYQAQVDDLTQKIGNSEYIDAKNVLLKSKNNFRILLINAKAQKEKVLIAIKDAQERAEREKRPFTIDERIDIIKSVLTDAPELIVTFDKGKATSWTKHKIGEKAEKRQEPLSEIDKTIETTAAKISDESHQKILQENLIREKVKKAQKEERVKSVNAYINAFGTIVGNAAGVGAFTGMPSMGGGSPISAGSSAPMSAGPTFAPQVAMPSQAFDNSTGGVAAGGNVQTATVATPRNIASLNTAPPVYGANPTPSIPADVMAASVGIQNQNIGGSVARNMGANVNTTMNTSPAVGSNAPAMPAQPTVMPSAPVMAGGYMPMAGLMPMGAMPAMPQQPSQPNYNREYQDFDLISEGIEPCIIPYIVGYDQKGVTIYGNMMERYAIMDRYKFLLTTNNNALYPYIETKQAQVQTPEQVISDLHIRYIKNAMSKSGLSTQDGNFATFDYKADVRRFLSQYVPQNLIDIVINDYNELCASIDFDLLRDLIEHKFLGDLEGYIPEDIKEGFTKSANMIASVAKAIMSNPQVRKTYEAYSSKMKQTYISNLIAKIETGDIPTVKLNSEEAYNRILDYVSFSIKGQNVIIQAEDAKDSGLNSYPRSVFFRQKDNADQALKRGKTLTFEQNEIITTRNEPDLDKDSEVVNLFGTLYKFNGAYNKLLLKLKPLVLTGGVNFMENLIDAINEKIDLKVTVLNQDSKKNTVSLVKFASKEKNKVISDEDKVFVYEDDNWFVRKGFVLDKNKIKEYAMQLAFGFKYALEKNKESLKEAFYNNNILSLNKINETFKDQSEEMVSLITSVIRDVMMSKCERVIDYIDYINERNSLQMNKMLYINRMILESNNFDKKTKDEKLETLIALDSDFMTKSEDIIVPHPEIYSSIEELERYEGLYLYYALSDLFEKFSNDERFINKELSDYFEDLKRKYRNKLLAMIRDKISLNGYEQDLTRYFELKQDDIIDIELEESYEEEEEIIDDKKITKLRNIDIIFRGIFEGYQKAIKGETNSYVLEEMKEVGELLEIVGELPRPNSAEKELEIALPNNQSIVCNIKGFLQQYLFRFIVDKEHELGPFAYVVSELVEHEELADSVKNVEIVANKLNAPELGINLIAKFSTINISNDGNVLKIGDNISTVVEIVNRLKTPTDQQKALNRDVFYKEGVAGVQEIFEQYFNRLKIEQMQ